DGQPLPGGTITFTPIEGKGNPMSATIREDGTYEMDAPTGLCKIAIDNRSAGKSHTPIGAGGPPTATDLPVGEHKGPTYSAPGMPKEFIGKKESGPPQTGGAEEIAKAMQGKHATSGASTPIAGKAVPINPKYYSPESSGLELKVKGGAQTFDIKLQQ